MQDVRKDIMRRVRRPCGHSCCQLCGGALQFACPLCPLERGTAGGRFADADSFHVQLLSVLLAEK